MFTAEEIIDLWNRTESDRTSFRSLRKSAGIYVLPHANNLMIPPKDAKASQGAEKTVNLTDTTAGDANRNLAAGLYAYLFPVNEQPFTLKAEPEELNDKQEYADAMTKVTKIVQYQIQNSNFPLEFFSFLEHLGAYGGACMYQEKNKGKGPILSFRNIHIQNVLVLYDSSGNVDTVMHRYAFTPRQAAQEWVPSGSDKQKVVEILGEKLAGKLETKTELHQPQDFIHIVYPRATWNPLKVDKEGKEWVSQHVYVEGKHLTHEGGYEENPYSVVWFWKSSDEDEGRGPGTEGLPEFRMINRQTKTFIKAAEKQCDPPIMMPDDGAVSPMRTDPSGIIYYRPGLTQKDIWALDTKADARLTREVLDRQQEIIYRKFFNHLFQPLADYRNMTATEAIERTEQNLRLLIPPVGRLQKNLLNQQIIRSVGILQRAGYFPFLDVLDDFNFSITYLGKLALAIKELEGHALSQSLNIWVGYLQVDPSPLDNINADVGFKETMRARGVPANWLKDEDRVNEERQIRMQREMMSQTLEAAESAGKASKDLGKPIDETSPLAQLGAA